MHANLHIKTISRSQSRTTIGAAAYRSGSVVASAAYRSGEKIKDERYGKTHDFRQKENVLHSEIITPEGAPDWMKDRESLWNEVEAGEKRKDAQLAKEVVLTLPRNLSPEQHTGVVRNFIKENITSRGLVADFAIHSPDASDGGKNPHSHVMFTLRPVKGDGFGKKQSGYLDGKLDSKATLQQFRESYQGILNKASEKADSAQRFDLRSLKAKGIDRQPQLKIGPKVKYLEKRGYDTQWGKTVRQVEHMNHAQAGYQRHTGSYQLIGGGSRQPGFVAESIRADIADKYYEVAYGRDTKHKDFYSNDDRERGFER